MKIISKLKPHLLVHLRQDIVRFGPLVGVATETFECFNAIFRMCSVLSNHLAPGRDIAFQLASQEGLKHRLTGGWWSTATNDGEDWVRSGNSVRDFLHSQTTLQGLLGWSSHEPLQPGTFRLEPIKRELHKKQLCQHPEYELSNTPAAMAINCASYNMSSFWKRCLYFVAQSHDKCMKDSWVASRSPITGNHQVGRVVDILAGCNKNTILVVLDIFEVLLTRHDTLDMPMLSRRQSESTLMIVEAKDVQFLFNAQHDCHLAACQASGSRAIRQERQDSGRTEAVFVHQPVDRYVVNIHALHNAHLIRNWLPRHLTAPVPVFEARQAKHHEIATTLRRTQEDKRAARQKNKEAKKALQLADEDEGNDAGPSTNKKRKRVIN